MDVTVFSTRGYDREFLDIANSAAGAPHVLHFIEAGLSKQTAALAKGATAICVFVNDRLDRTVLASLREQGTRLVALRSAGFNHVDLEAAEALGIAVARVPSYSPEAIAEHTIALILSLNRKLHRAYVRVREGNFALDGLLGFDLGKRTVGIVGTGKIGATVTRILGGFGCRILAFDPSPDADLVASGVEYVTFPELLQQADVISIHCPLTPQTHHLINGQALQLIRPGAMLINTSRGAVIDTKAVIEGLKSGKIGSLGLDVYEEEGDLFFRDLSDEMLQDDVFARLLTFPNVLITGHQAFFTREALSAIAETTIRNISTFETTGQAEYQIGTELLT
ncbi:hydroxyacid dehydrogenase [Sphingobium sp. GW456-12-10-14-TSB1]|uniref:2-hydroxyacid dehydrogenase n=1 Tax=Sphingobium sp. GW456-12-10-14-TSB1 TaxID=1987165 RepID=UPI000A393E04|nr:2-hydroxyacid dehydrogenase [Sphingobium sp. GW456-12-10-14-TSB1]OUC54494.1 hydroxyacid dehydrogenase [Sphingobium sp. GW456-12-10-14-TSB1]